MEELMYRKKLKFIKNKKRFKMFIFNIIKRLFVRVKGLEPPRREAPDPKSGVSTNFTTPASDERFEVANIHIFCNKKYFSRKKIIKIFYFYFNQFLFRCLWWIIYARN
ncbi:hypothetical protein CCYN74_80073 [Capnocytophaga cynodegmi]|uniref:Uncharacterized protein n=1 Tax=Capnocytophaga cynodegmi TaxID=28189 RepID=A0A0B7HQ87_9FLAO|nr:hypothetical protein CCYN74_80073 [Capnocytophaga cynodegmi]